VFEFYIRAIVPDPGYNCEDQPWQFAIEHANIELTKVITPGVPPCSTNTTKSVKVTTVACWKIVNTNPNPAGLPWYLCQICPGTTGKCSILYEVCTDAFGNLQSTYVSSSFTSASCTEAPPLTWEEGYCYVINPCFGL